MLCINSIEKYIIHIKKQEPNILKTGVTAKNGITSELNPYNNSIFNLSKKSNSNMLRQQHHNYSFLIFNS